MLICILFWGISDFDWNASRLFFFLYSFELEVMFSTLRNHSEKLTPHMFINAFQLVYMYFSVYMFFLLNVTASCSNYLSTIAGILHIYYHSPA